MRCTVSQLMCYNSVRAQGPAPHARKTPAPTRECVFNSGRASAVTAA